MWQRNLQDAWHHGKRAVGNIFNHAVKWAGQIDHAMGVGKRIFSAIQPAIQDMGGAGGAQLNRSIMQGISGYEQGRHAVTGQHNQVQAHLSRLRRATPELDL